MKLTRRAFHIIALSSALHAAPPVLVAIPLLEGGQYTDVFDPTIEKQIREKCTKRTQQLRRSREPVAYVWTAVPAWNRDWVRWFRKQPGDSPGKQQYV